jgi:hypothetical protein
MIVEQVSMLVWGFGAFLAAWLVRRSLRAFVASRRMRLFYEAQSPEKRKEIEASWKQGSLNGTYTKPVTVGQAILCLAAAFLLLVGLTYLTYVHPLRLHMHR